jgi:hypothetical protein
MIDFTPLDDAFDASDYEWMTQYAPTHLAVIERLVKEGATPQQIKDRCSRRIGAERQQFVSRCEGAARYLRANKAE